MALQVQEVSADYTGMISEADYQEFLRYDGTDQAAILPTLVEGAIRVAEDYCNATFGLKTFVMQKQTFERNCNIYLPFAPIISVQSVKLIAQDGTETVLADGEGYVLGGLDRKYIVLLTSTYNETSILQVEYTAGTQNPANVNAKVKTAILAILSEIFENRMQGIDAPYNKLPLNSKALLGPYRNNIF